MAGARPRAGPRGRPGALRAEGPAPARPQAPGQEAPRPAAREPAAGRLCWGGSPPSGAPGKRLPASGSLINPLGKEVLAAGPPDG